MEAEHSYLERCYISFKKLVNGCIAIFVACSWSAWFLSVLKHWNAVEESSDTVKFFIASFWSVCLYIFVSFILYFTEVRDDRRLALQELLGFQFKNAVVALAAVDLFESAHGYGTFATALVALVMFTCILFSSRMLRSYNHVDGTPFEHILHETEMDGTALACGFGLNLALVHLLFGDEGKPSLEGVSGLPAKDAEDSGIGGAHASHPSGPPVAPPHMSLTAMISAAPSPSSSWVTNSSGNSTNPTVPGLDPWLSWVVFLIAIGVCAKLCITLQNHIEKLHEEEEKERRGKEDHAINLYVAFFHTVFELTKNTLGMFCGWILYYIIRLQVNRASRSWLVVDRAVTNALICIMYSVAGIALLASSLGKDEELKQEHDEMLGYAELGDGENEVETATATDEKLRGGFRGRRKLERSRERSLKVKARKMKMKIERNKLFVLAISLCVGFAWEEAWDGYLEVWAEHDPVLWEGFWAVLMTIGYIIYAVYAPWAKGDGAHDHHEQEQEQEHEHEHEHERVGAHSHQQHQQEQDADDELE